VIAAGRRSYKTETMKRSFVSMSMTNPDHRYFLGAPTRMQAKEIFWEDIKQLTPKCMIKDKSESMLYIEYFNNTRLYVVGLDAYERIEGIRWNGAGISEFQHIEKDFFVHTLQPILNDTNGVGWFEGRPTGLDVLYEYSLYAKQYENWGFYTWKSADVMSVLQIEQAKRELDIVSFQQEYEALFVANQGRTYYTFDTNIHLKVLDIDRSLPFICACDFNAGIKPMTWTIGQEIDSTYWFKTFSFQFTNTQAMIEKVCTYFIENSYPYIKFYGDYSGTKNTSNSSLSDWQIIQNYCNSIPNLKYEVIIRPTISIRDRVAATNSRFKSATEEVHQYVHPTDCAVLVDDLLQVTWKENGVQIDGSNDLRTHASDGIDYYNMVEHSIYGYSKAIIE
jgi:hypothetical protein